MKKIICLMLLLCVTVLGGCESTMLRDEYDYILEKCFVVAIIDLEDNVLDHELLIDKGTYDFYADTYVDGKMQYTFRFKGTIIGIRFIRDSGTEYRYIKYDIAVSLDVYQDYVLNDKQKLFGVIV